MISDEKCPKCGIVLTVVERPDEWTTAFICPNDGTIIVKDWVKDRL